MEAITVIALDLTAIAVLVFGLYFPRHHRRDLVAAYLGVNIGVLAVSEVLASSTVSFGLGMGLFGVLSIIRLRSYEIDQHEIAYYFSALAIGLLSGLATTPTLLIVGLIALVVGGMAIGDHPRLLTGYHQQLVIVDRAIADEAQLHAHLEQLLGGRILRTTVKRLDIVNDSTQVDVRFRIER